MAGDSSSIMRSSEAFRSERIAVCDMTAVSVIWGKKALRRR